MTCKPFDVVIVPFPFTDRRASKHRPALALSSEAFSRESGHTVLAMITSADNSPWPMNVQIDAASVGLNFPSKKGGREDATWQNTEAIHRNGVQSRELH